MWITEWALLQVGSMYGDTAVWFSHEPLFLLRISPRNHLSYAQPPESSGRGKQTVPGNPKLVPGFSTNKSRDRSGRLARCSGSPRQLVSQAVDQLSELGVCLDGLTDALVAMHDRGVVSAAEVSTDFIPTEPGGCARRVTDYNVFRFSIFFCPNLVKSGLCHRGRCIVSVNPQAK